MTNRAQLFSRRVDAAVNFAPDMDPESPFAQMRRLSARLQQSSFGPDAITDCTEALSYLRELTYRKIFTGTSHEEFVQLDKESPEVIDWLICVHDADSEAFRNTQNKGKSNSR